MGLYNMPDGCMYPSDLDQHDALNPEPQCKECGWAKGECDCPIPDEEAINYWQERSELFEPDDVFAPPFNDFTGWEGVE